MELEILNVINATVAVNAKIVEAVGNEMNKIQLKSLLTNVDTN
jgi:hypothetical protein